MYSLIIIDDEKISRMTLSGYISSFHPDFQVTGTFSNGAEALEYLEKHPVHVIITDIRMPQMDGLEFSAYVHEHFPHITLIIISGFCEFEYAQKAIRYGVISYLNKPVDFDELSLILKRVSEKLRTTYIQNSCCDEDIQLFFSELINGNLDEKEALLRFSALEWEGHPQDYHGCLLYVDLESSKELNKWKYERETLATTLTNGLRMILTDCSVYYLFRLGMRYFFIILQKDAEPAIYTEPINTILFRLLHFQCSTRIQTSFAGILSLLHTPFPEYHEILAPPSYDLDEVEQDTVIQKSKEYIQLHYAEDITRDDVAAAVYLSPVYFSRIFKQKTGLNYIDYLTSLRMQKAAEFLSTSMDIQDISRAVGYQSRNRFYVNFRQYFGCTPTEYRRQNLNNGGFS